MTADEIAEAMRDGYRELIDFASTKEFQALLDELYAQPPAERPSFVNRVILSEQELASRGIVTPPGILVLRSSFGDRRPTLFCLKKYLSEFPDTVWQNVNLTFDNPIEDGAVPIDRRAWRQPLPFDVQQAMVASGASGVD